MDKKDIKKSALVLIEYQNEWLDKDSKLQKLITDKKQFSKAVENSKKLLSHAREIGMNIVHVPFLVSGDYREFGEAKFGLRSVIQKVKTWQGEAKEFNEDFTPKENEFIVSGRVGASGFEGSNLDILLKNNQIQNLFIIGFATNVCVESTFRSSHDKGYNSYVITDATGTFRNEDKEYFSSQIVHHFGCEISTDMFLEIC